MMTIPTEEELCELEKFETWKQPWTLGTLMRLWHLVMSVRYLKKALHLAANAHLSETNTLDYIPVDEAVEHWLEEAQKA